MLATSNCILSSRSTSAPIGPQSSPFGATPIRFFYQLGPMLLSETIREHKSSFSKPGISLSKRTAQKSERRSYSSSPPFSRAPSLTKERTHEQAGHCDEKCQ